MVPSGGMEEEVVEEEVVEAEESEYIPHRVAFWGYLLVIHQKEDNDLRKANYRNPGKSLVHQTSINHFQWKDD